MTTPQSALNLFALSPASPAAPEALFLVLRALNIAFTNHTHAPVMTVEQSRALRGDISGLHAKNLFLKDKKGGFWLVAAEESQTVDLKVLRKQLGVANLSFAPPATLMEVLGVTPGTVTPFSVLNDRAGRARVVLDRALAEAHEANFHPLDNAQTTTLGGAELVRFLTALDHAPLVVDFTPADQTASG